MIAFLFQMLIKVKSTLIISEIDITTGIITPINSLDIFSVNLYVLARIEYVGNDIIFISIKGDADALISINLNTEETTTQVFFSEGAVGLEDIFYIENEIDNVTLSTSEFTCDDLGENTIIVTQEDQTTCEVTITIIDPIQTDCQPFIEIEAAEGETSTPLPDYTSNFSNICGGITVTQTPEPGTIININEMVTVIITITDADGEETIFEFIVEFRSLSIDDKILSNSIQLYPNPTPDLITIYNNNIDVQLSELIIFDINGRALETMNLQNLTTKETTITLEKYPSGIYFARIVSPTASTVRRIIKK